MASKTGNEGKSQPPAPSGRLAELEAEVAHLRAELADRESRLDSLEARITIESQIRLVADALPVLIAYVDAGQRFLYTNKAHEGWFGGRRSRFLGRTLEEMLGADAYARLRPLVERALAGERLSEDVALPGAEGGPRHIHLEYVPDRRADGRIAGFFSLVQDISETKRAEQTLRESEARFRAMADCAPVPVWVTNEKGIDFVSRAFLDVVGGPPEKVTGEAWMRLIHPDDLAKVVATRDEAWKTGAAYSYEARFNLPSGERWMHVSSSPRLDENGKLIGYVGMAVDFTDQKNAEIELRESEARFRAIADIAPALIWVTDENGILFANRPLIEFSGLPESEFLGPAWMSFIHPDDAETVNARRAKAWADQAAYDFEARFRRADGEWRWLRAQCQPRETREGFSGYVGLAIDVTEERKAQAELVASESLLTAMFDSAGVGIALLDREWRIERANAAFCAIVGRAFEEVRGTAWRGVSEAEELTPDAAGLAALEAGSAYAFEREYHSRDGRTLWLRITLSAVGEQWLAIVEDVSARRKTEDALRASEQALRSSEDRLRLATEAGAIGIWDFDLVNGVLRWDSQVCAAFGLSPDAPVDYDLFLAGIHPDDRQATDDAVARALDPNGPGDYDIESRTVGLEDGVERWVAARGRAFFADGHAVRFLGTTIDISEAKRAEQALGESRTALIEESRVLQTLNRIGAALAAELDVERVVKLVTDAGVEVSGAQLGAFFYNVVRPSGDSYMLYALSGEVDETFRDFPMPRNTAVFASTFAGEGVVRSDDISLDPRYGQNAPHQGLPEGHPQIRSYLAVPVVSRSGGVIGGLFFGHEEAGRFSERHEQLLTGIAGQAAVAIDNARLFEAAQRELGERRRVEEALRELNQSLESRIAAAIAEREAIEEALRQAQKMEAVGQLTGGIAHDFNNLLTVISGNLDLATRRLGAETDPRVHRAIASALAGADRAATLTQRLLAFSRRQPLAPRSVDANALLLGMSDLLHRTLGETVEVATLLAPTVWRIEVDPHQLESAVLNLAVNGRDAMPDGGTLTIETACTRLGPDEGTAGEEVAAGDYVEIVVTDTGFGMDAETAKRAVEPFFTTKDVGKGTGLGLSMVYGFVRQSGGHLRIESREGEGTSVRVYLPRAIEDAVEEKQAETAAAPRGAVGETVLVCEDDDEVRAYTTELLRELGYQVIAAADGAEALAMLGNPETRVDLLFTDVVLPGGTSGAVLARRAVQLRPGLKVLYTTGYARDAIVQEGRLEPGIELVTKPFALNELAERVREILDRP